MKFLVDECTGTSVANWLIEQNHEVFSVFEQLRGATDNDILDKCYTENYILITSDKDFGEMIFRQKKKHRGVIFIRCKPDTFKKRIELLEKFLEFYKDEISENFIVINNETVRIVSTP